ncbi:MAG: diguanylate cyclase [Pseudomonas sp.]
MSSFTNQQLQSVIAQFDLAIHSHDQWYKNLLRVLISHLPPEEVDLMPDAHRRCRFGQLYGSPQAAFLQENPAFISLGDAHQKMHLSARSLFQRIADDLPIPLNDWDHFDHDVDEMRLKFQDLRYEFAEIVQNRDPLTGAQTRASMLRVLREQNALVKRGRQDCALAMIDLDHFKRINDEYGHTAGDAVLVSTVKCLKALLRPYDRIYRYGGEEFLIVMPSTNLEQARQVAERMRAAIAEQRVQLDKSEEFLHVTASFGVAILTKLRKVEESIDHADKAMYEAKVTGRNRVVADR